MKSLPAISRLRYQAIFKLSVVFFPYPSAVAVLKLNKTVCAFILFIPGGWGDGDISFPKYLYKEEMRKAPFRLGTFFHRYSYLSKPPLGQYMTQGQF